VKFVRDAAGQLPTASIFLGLKQCFLVAFTVRRSLLRGHVAGKTA